MDELRKIQRSQREKNKGNRTAQDKYKGAPRETYEILSAISGLLAVKPIKRVIFTSNNETHASFSHISTFMMYGKSTYFAAPAFAVIAMNLQK